MFVNFDLYFSYFRLKGHLFKELAISWARNMSPTQTDWLSQTGHGHTRSQLWTLSQNSSMLSCLTVDSTKNGCSPQKHLGSHLCFLPLRCTVRQEKQLEQQGSNPNPLILDLLHHLISIWRFLPSCPWWRSSVAWTMWRSTWRACWAPNEEPIQVSTCFHQLSLAV